MRETEGYIKDKVVEWLKRNALGRVNAKPRRLLKAYIVNELFFELSDRTLRRIYASTNHVGYACSDPKGIYWIADPTGIRTFRDEQKAKAVAIFARTKKTELAVEGERQQRLI